MTIESSNPRRVAEQRLRNRRQALERWLKKAPIAFRDRLHLQGRIRGFPATEWGLSEWIAAVQSFQDDWLKRQRAPKPIRVPKSVKPKPYKKKKLKIVERAGKWRGPFFQGGAPGLGKRS